MIELKIKEDTKLLSKLAKIALVSGVDSLTLKNKMLTQGVDQTIVDTVLNDNRSVTSNLYRSEKIQEGVASAAMNLVDVVLSQNEDELDEDDRRALREMISWQENSSHLN